MGRMSPVQLALFSERSRHGCVTAIWSESGTAVLRQGISMRCLNLNHAVSRCHSLPHGTGAFPHSMLGSKLPVCALRSRASPALRNQSKWLLLKQLKKERDERCAS